jgi:hypothetical protein
MIEGGLPYVGWAYGVTYGGLLSYAVLLAWRLARANREQ